MYCNISTVLIHKHSDVDADLDFSLPIVMKDVSCPSSTLTTITSLQDCEFSRDTSACSHTANDIGLTCSNCSLYLCDNGECINAVQCDGRVECQDGSDENNIICGKNDR